MRLPEGWTLSESSGLDLWELGRAYNHYSGGLLMEAFNLNEGRGQAASLEDIYQKAGFFRRHTTYSLRQQDELQAVFIVDQSEVGLNLSELLNGIKIIVTNSDHLPWNVLSIAIAQLTRVYRMEKVPVLFSPAHYVEDKGLPFEKHYFLWILDVSFGNDYMEFMQDRFKVGYKPMPRGEGQGAPSTP
jgi:hypothetical protein